MCDVNNDTGTEDLTGLAARFIAETNAFLDQFWAHPNVRWPIKPHAGTIPGWPRCPASASNGSITAPANPVAPAEQAAFPELVVRLGQLQQLLPADGNEVGPGVDMGAGGGSPAYVFFLLVPEERSCPEALMQAIGLVGVCLHDNLPIGIDVLPSPSHPVVTPRSRPGRRQAATLSV